MSRSIWPATCISLLVSASATWGHALNPSLLDIRQDDHRAIEVVWKTPLERLPGTSIEPELPAPCRAIRAPAVSYDETSLTTRWTVDCGEAGLVGQTVAVNGLDDSKTDVLLRISLADGRQLRGVLSARHATYVVPERAPWHRVATSYLSLGIEHILLGFDHLLFVLALLLLVPGGRRLAITITAFTFGHSITLCWVALGLAQVPSAPVEVAIAFSIFILAVELARPAESERSLMRRSPWALATVFGLLHGLGFAGALAEIGLPQGDVPLALLAFNIGIEIGQLVFVGAILGGRQTLRQVIRPWLTSHRPWLTNHRVHHWSAGLQAAPVYLIGTLSAFWTLERLAALF